MSSNVTVKKMSFAQSFAHKKKQTFNALLQNKATAPIMNRLGLRDYDLPLEQSDDTQFLTLLIALMSLLAVLACAGMISLNNMAERWSTGLENKVTIEIPVETKSGYLLSDDTVQSETQKLYKDLKKHPLIKSVKILEQDDIQELLSPWIGQNLVLDDIPLPGLLALELKNSASENIEVLKRDIMEISDYANLETHHEWLADLIKFVKTLKSIAIIVLLIIITTTIIAIITGIRTRLAIHHKEIELLHAIGATDSYIARQLQRHAMIIALKGSMIGTILGLFLTYIITMIANNAQSELLPKIEISYSHSMIFLSIPILITLITLLSARYTLLRSLSKMP